MQKKGTLCPLLEPNQGISQPNEKTSSSEGGEKLSELQRRMMEMEAETMRMQVALVENRNILKASSKALLKIQSNSFRLL